MNVREAVALFKREMMNEIYHSFAEEAAQDALIEAVKRVERMVIATCEAEQEAK